MPQSCEIATIGNKMHVLIFVYSVFTSLTLTFSVSTLKCTIWLAFKNYISYSGYVAPTYHTLHHFQITRPLGTSIEYDGCFRFQFIAASDIFRVRFPAESAVQVTMLGCRWSKCHCGSRIIFEPLEFLAYKKDQSYILKSDSMTVYACRRHLLHIIMTMMPCKVPCKLILDQGLCDLGHGSKMMIYDNYENIICDICENYYSGCTTNYFGTALRTDASFTLRIKSDICLSACVRILDYKSSGIISPTISVIFRGDVLKIPALNTVNYIILLSGMCDIEVPIAALETNPPMLGSVLMTPYEVKTVFWGGVLYRCLSQLPPVTWERAAQYCSEAEASLLIIHSSAEYQFLEDNVLQARDTSLLYVGWRREVMCIVCLIYV